MADGVKGCGWKALALRLAEHRFRELLAAGYTRREIAEMHGVCPVAVYRLQKAIVKVGGEDFRKTKGRKRLTPEGAEAIVRAATEGLSHREIAEATGYSIRTVSRILRAHGLMRRRRWTRREERYLVERYEAGESPEAIAEALGRTVGGVYGKLRSLGLRKPDIDPDIDGDPLPDPGVEEAIRRMQEADPELAEAVRAELERLRSRRAS